MNSLIVNGVNDIGGRPERSEGVGFGKPAAFNTIYIYIFKKIYIFVHALIFLEKSLFSQYLKGLKVLAYLSERPCQNDEKPCQSDEKPCQSDEKPCQSDAKGHVKAMKSHFKISIKNIRNSVKFFINYKKTLLIKKFYVLLFWNKKRGIGSTPKILKSSEVSIYDCL